MEDGKLPVKYRKETKLIPSGMKRKVILYSYLSYGKVLLKTKTSELISPLLNRR